MTRPFRDTVAAFHPFQQVVVCVHDRRQIHHLRRSLLRSVASVGAEGLHETMSFLHCDSVHGLLSSVKCLQ